MVEAGTQAALVWIAPRPFRGVFLFTMSLPIMMQDETQAKSEEPVGIVISRGWEPQPTPLFSAYMWGPVPDDEPELDAQAA